MPASGELEGLRVRTAERLAELFEQNNIRYVVVSGLYGYPSRVGRDLDIIIEKKDVLQAVKLVERIKQELGWQFFFGRWAYYGVMQLFLVRPSRWRIVWFEIDLINENLIVGTIPLFTVSEILSRKFYLRGPFRVSPEGEYFKAFFRPIYYGDVERFRKKYSLKPPRTKEEEEVLKALLGRRLFAEYMEKLGASLDELKQWSKKLKWKLNLHYALRHPVSAFRNFLWTRFIRPFFLWLFNPGFVVAIVGPDGVGKSSAIQQAVEHLNGLFDIRVRHWRPHLLPSPAKLVGKEPRGATFPNRKKPSVVEHWFRIFYYWMDYVLGYLFKDRFIPKSVIQLVTYDRHAIDTRVDPVRYRLRSSIGTTLLYRFSPRPYVILLKDSPEQVVFRKDELSIQEIKEQFALWEKLTEEGLVDAVVEAGSSVEETGWRLANEIVKVASKKYAIHKTDAYVKF